MSEETISFSMHDKDLGSMTSFILKKPMIGSVKLTEKMIENDRFMKFKVDVLMTGEMIITENATTSEIHFSRSKKHLKYETYSEYLIRRELVPEKNVKWAYNIVDGISEQERILFRNDDFIIIPTLAWDEKNIFKLHILALFTNKDLKTLRDLKKDHIPLLESALKEGFKIIKNLYNVDEDKIKAYFHYPPSTWLLHIHFNSIDYTTVSSSVEYSHLVRNVIENINLVDDYYSKVSLCST